MPNQHTIESVWKSLRRWIATYNSGGNSGDTSGGGGGPGLQDAEVARQSAQRTPPPKPAVIGGVDEPDIEPMRKGDKCRVLILRPGDKPMTLLATVAHLRAQCRRGNKRMQRLNDRWLCTNRELRN